jgi:hypothetical protein
MQRHDMLAVMRQVVAELRLGHEWQLTPEAVACRLSGDWAQGMSLEGSAERGVGRAWTSIMCLAEPWDTWTFSPGRVRTPSGRNTWTKDDAAELALGFAAALDPPTAVPFDDAAIVRALGRRSDTGGYADYDRAVLAMRAGQPVDARRSLERALEGMHPAWPARAVATRLLAALDAGIPEACAVLDSIRSATGRALRIAR